MVLCLGRLCSISVESHLMAQFWADHQSTKYGLGYGDICIFSKCSNDAVKQKKIGSPARGYSSGYGGDGESLLLIRETRS